MKKFKVPKGLTEAEVLKVVEEVVYRLATKFRFGYHDNDDLKQEARLIALEGIHKWDGVRSLKNFLWTHVKNRLINFKRDKYQRIEPPCQRCPINLYDKKQKKCTKYNEDYLEDCGFYYEWILRNLTKRNLMDVANIDCIDDREEHNMWSDGREIGETVDNDELLKRIKDRIPLDQLDNYNKYINGAKMNSLARTKMKELILSIIDEEGITYG
jgi:hypothetical protein